MSKGGRRKRLSQGRQKQPDRHDPSPADDSPPVYGRWAIVPGRDSALLRWSPGSRPARGGRKKGAGDDAG